MISLFYFNCTIVKFIFFMSRNYIFRRSTWPACSPQGATWEVIFTFMNEEAKLGILVGRKVSHTGGGGEGAHSSREESEWASGASEWVAVEAWAWGRSQCVFFCALCCLLVSTNIWHHCCGYDCIVADFIVAAYDPALVFLIVVKINLIKNCCGLLCTFFKRTFKSIVLVSVLHI